MSKRNSKKSFNRHDSSDLARSLARFIESKKGEEVIIFDLRNLSPLTDYFVIANGLSDIHVRTIANYLIEQERPTHVEGLEGGSWVLIDYFDIIVHLFVKEARQFYGLERLWGDAPKIAMDDD